MVYIPLNTAPKMKECDSIFQPGTRPENENRLHDRGIFGHSSGLLKEKGRGKILSLPLTPTAPDHSVRSLITTFFTSVFSPGSKPGSWASEGKKIKKTAGVAGYVFTVFTAYRPMSLPAS